MIAILTMCSRVLGLARECVFGYLFSTSELLSAFRIAFMVPNLTRRLFGEGALSSSMIPVLTEDLRSRGEESSRRLVGTIITLLVVVLSIVLVVGEIIILSWRHLRPDVALDLAAILLPYMVLICTVAVAGGALNVRRHFATPALAPTVLNVSIIVFALVGSLWLGLAGERLMTAVAVSVLVAGVGQLAIVALAMRRMRFFPIFGGSWRDPRIVAVFALMGPMILGLSAVQINTLCDYLIAYVFVAGEKGKVGPAVLGYAHYLYQLPLGVFGIAIATAIFPVLSARAAEGDRRGLAETFAQGIRLSLFIALPSSVGLIFVAHPLVGTLFERGAFDAADTQRVAGVLVFYSLGLTAYFTQHVLVRAFYADHNSKTPARIAGLMVVVNLAMNLALVFPLQERGLALATACCSMVQVVWLWRVLRRSLPELGELHIMPSAAKTLVATAIMTATLVALTSPALLGGWLGSHHAVRLAVLVPVGAIAYGLAARAMGMEEWRQILHKEDASGTHSTRLRHK